MPTIHKKYRSDKYSLNYSRLLEYFDQPEVRIFFHNLQKSRDNHDLSCYYKECQVKSEYFRSRTISGVNLDLRKKIPPPRSIVDLSVYHPNTETAQNTFNELERVLLGLSESEPQPVTELEFLSPT